MTLKTKSTPNSLTLVFHQEIVIYKESVELNRTDVAMATPLPAAELHWDQAAEGLWWNRRPY